MSVPRGIHNVDGLHVTNDGKMFVMHPAITPKTPKIEGNPSIVVFPRREHLLEFENAAQHVRRFGPAEWNPGAVGTVKLLWPHTNVDPILWEAQAHYMTKGNPKLKDPEHGLPWDIINEYAGWRKRGFKHAIDIAGLNGKNLIVPSNLFFPKGFGKGVNESMLADFTKVCKENGIKHELIHNSDLPMTNPLNTYYLLNPKNKNI